jgi:HAD superfamily hydrolase (TIGR01509 family)
VSVGAVVFDFNGTLSDDEPILCEIWQVLFAERGVGLSREEYFGAYAGLADFEIAERGLGVSGEELASVLAERVARYRARVADGSSVGPQMRSAVRLAASRVPVAVVSGAAREEIETVLAAAGLRDAIAVVVAAEDVRAGKPDPEGFLQAAAALGVEPGAVVVFEDSEPGVNGAKAAGMRCVAVRGTAAPERLAAAEELVDRIDAALVERLLKLDARASE